VKFHRHRERLVHKLGAGDFLDSARIQDQRHKRPLIAARIPASTNAACHLPHERSLTYLGDRITVGWYPKARNVRRVSRSAGAGQPRRGDLELTRQSQ
jgi:hypothetical protein